MTITTITISTIDYIAYASVAEADARLAVDPTRATAWAALTDDQKGANLVASTNVLDLLNWAGEKTGGASQPNAWARTGVSYKDGTPVSTSEVPLEVQDATILYAGTITLTPAAGNVGTSGSNTKRVKAGSAEAEFFRPTSGTALQDDTAFKLVQCFLAGASSVASVGNLASGTGEGSAFCDPSSPGLIEGYP